MMAGTWDYRSGNFPVPKKIFSLGLSAGEIVVYCYLLSCMSWKTRTCYPSFNTIASAVGYSKNTVAKYVQSLEEKGLISTMRTEVQTKKHGVRNGNLIYSVQTVEDAINAQVRRQAQENDLRELQQKLNSGT